VEIGSLVVAKGHRHSFGSGADDRGPAARGTVARDRARLSERELLALYQRWRVVLDRKIELSHLSGNHRVLYLIKELTSPDQGESYGGGWEGISSV